MRYMFLHHNIQSEKRQGVKVKERQFLFDQQRLIHQSHRLLFDALVGYP
jgi:hypothetical protein